MIYMILFFLTVRENQLYQALKELKSNKSKNIITMVNSIDTYEKWESIVGKGRILPAFPGAGGSITNDILDASLTPRFIQPTTFSEITGKKTNRTQQLIQIFKHARIPFQQVNDMHIWQLCHLGMVVPLADAYYQTEYPESVGQDKLVMKNTAKELKYNFKIYMKNFIHYHLIKCISLEFHQYQYLHIFYRRLIKVTLDIHSCINMQ